MCGALLEVEMFKKCTPLWHEAHFEVKRVKKRAVSEHILRVSHGRRNGFCTSPKMSQFKYVEGGPDREAPEVV